MAVLLHAVPLAGVCRKERSSPVPQVRARPEEMRCVGSKRTPEVGRDMLLAASIVKFSGTKAPGGNRTVKCAAAAAGPSSRLAQSVIALSAFCSDHSWNYPFEHRVLPHVALAI